MFTCLPDTWLQPWTVGTFFSAGGRDEGDWCQTPGLMGIAHDQSRLDVCVRWLFPFEVWKEWGESSLFQFLLGSSLLFIFLPLVHTVCPILESYKQDIWG